VTSRSPLSVGLDGDAPVRPPDRPHGLAEADVESLGDSVRQLIVAAGDLAEDLGAEMESVGVDEAQRNRRLDLDQGLEERVRGLGEACPPHPRRECLERDRRSLLVRSAQLGECGADSVPVEQPVPDQECR
jgi:hypothetical protein